MKKNNTWIINFILDKLFYDEIKRKPKPYWKDGKGWIHDKEYDKLIHDKKIIIENNLIRNGLNNKDNKVLVYPRGYSRIVIIL